MDKTERKGIALFITLLVIASILSIIAVSFSYLEIAQQKSGRVSAVIQGNLLYQNTINILKRFFPKGKLDAQKASLIYSMPLSLKEKKSGFEIVLSCEPLFKTIPIKWLDEKFTKKHTERFNLAKEVLEKILEDNNIEDPDLLEDMIFSAVNGINKSDELRLKPKAGIYTKEQFYSILEKYFFEVEDENVYKIRWDRYFLFIDVTTEAKIDGKYITSELISTIFDIPLDSVKEEWRGDAPSFSLDGGEDKKSNLREFLTDNGIESALDDNLYSKEPLNAMRCEERFFYKDRYYGFKFDYSNERSVNFEFLGEI